MLNIEMIEPTDPQERQAAIRICRANSHLHPETGEPVSDLKESKQLWDSVKDTLPYKKWIWMWNYGESEWRPSQGKLDGERS